MFCVPHMRAHGQQPRRRMCQQVGCGRAARVAVGGSTAFCRAHMAAHGQEPMDTDKRCAVEGCNRWVGEVVRVSC